MCHSLQTYWRRVALVVACVLVVDGSLFGFGDKLPAEFAHDGQLYDEGGRLIGPLQLTVEEKVLRLQSLLGHRGSITRTDGRVAKNATLLRLEPDSFGRFDAITFRSGPWTETVPVDEISEINAGGQVLVLGAHVRRSVQLRVYNIPKAWARVEDLQRDAEYERERLANISVDIQQRERLLEQRETVLAEERATLTAETAATSEKLAMREASLLKRQRELEEAEMKNRLERSELLAKRKEMRVEEARSLEAIERETETLAKREDLLAERDRELDRRERTIRIKETELESTVPGDKALRGIVRRGKTPVSGVKVDVGRSGSRMPIESVVSDSEGRFRCRYVAFADYEDDSPDFWLRVDGVATTIHIIVRSKSEVWVVLPP